MNTFEFNKVARAAFFDELQNMVSQGDLPADFFMKTAGSTVDMDALVKEALNLAGVRAGINSAAGKIHPNLARGMGELGDAARASVAPMAHHMQQSPNSFVQGAGNALHHKLKSNLTAGMAAANPIGTAAEVLATGAGTAGAKGMAGLGGRLQQAAGAADDVVREGRGMTPMGAIKNRLEGAGQRAQQSFSDGGLGHKALTKWMPKGVEVGSTVAAGMATGVPMSLAGALGHGTLAAGGAMAPVAAHMIGEGVHAGTHALGGLAEGALGAGGAHGAEQLASHVGGALGSHGGEAAHALGAGGHGGAALLGAGLQEGAQAAAEHGGGHALGSLGQSVADNAHEVLHHGASDVLGMGHQAGMQKAPTLMGRMGSAIKGFGNKLTGGGNNNAAGGQMAVA